MGFFNKMLDWWLGVERAAVPVSSDDTKNILIHEEGKILSAAELYDEVVTANKKEAADDREAFRARVAQKMN